MNIKVNRKTNIDYDKILDGVVWIFYLTNTADKWKIRQRCADLRDRQEVDDNKYPIYKGRFGNALIALRYGKTTDKLYLMSKEGLDVFRDRDIRGITAEQLEKYAMHTIEREEI